MDKFSVGEYKCFVQKKGKCEACLENMKEGEVFWTVKISKNGYYDTKNQDMAEIISRLVRIEEKL